MATDMGGATPQISKYWFPKVAVYIVSPLAPKSSGFNLCPRWLPKVTVLWPHNLTNARIFTNSEYLVWSCSMIWTSGADSWDVKWPLLALPYSRCTNSDVQATNTYEQFMRASCKQTRLLSTNTPTRVAADDETHVLNNCCRATCRCWKHCILEVRFFCASDFGILGDSTVRRGVHRDVAKYLGWDEANFEAGRHPEVGLYASASIRRHCRCRRHLAPHHPIALALALQFTHSSDKHKAKIGVVITQCTKWHNTGLRSTPSGPRAPPPPRRLMTVTAQASHGATDPLNLS